MPDSPRESSYARSVIYLSGSRPFTIGTSLETIFDLLLKNHHVKEQRALPEPKYNLTLTGSRTLSGSCLQLLCSSGTRGAGGSRTLPRCGTIARSAFQKPRRPLEGPA
jgi:hypothetical protein